MRITIKEQGFLYFVAFIAVVGIAVAALLHQSKRARFESMRLSDIASKRKVRDQFSDDMLNRVDSVIRELVQARFPLTPDPKLVRATIWDHKGVVGLDLDWLDFQRKPAGFQARYSDGTLKQYFFDKADEMTHRSSGGLVNEAVWEWELDREVSSVPDQYEIDVVTLIDEKGTPIGNSVNTEGPSKVRKSNGTGNQTGRGQ